jgi:uncharacterized protein YjbJ (UPF0337 family)
VNKDQAKGKLKQGEGKAQETWGDAKDKADDMVDDLKDKASRDESEDSAETRTADRR